MQNEVKIIWPDLMMPNLPDGSLGESAVAHNGKIVIVGANGSGKTRFGAWLENPSVRRHQASHYHSDSKRNEGVYRISAQRVLDLPPSAARKSWEEASAELNSGLGGPSGIGVRHTRVGGDPVVGSMADYGALINALFSARTADALRYYEAGQSSQFGPGKAGPDDLIRLKELWEKVFKGRELLVGDHTLSAKSKSDDEPYAASLMSDGERVGLYLIGSILLAPKSSRIVIDEPEVHLHEAIQSFLWDQLESVRKDCCFIYMTHSIQFAASRLGAKKIALLDYQAALPSDKECESDAQGLMAMGPVPTPPAGKVPRDGIWIWAEVAQSDDLPVDLTLKLLGSRRPVVFVEGKVGGLDQKFLEIVYSDHLVIPCDNWQKVVACVNGFRRQAALHHLHVRGLIDRDDRPSSEIDSHQKNDVYVLPVGAVECLYILPECLEACAAITGVQNPEDIVSEAKKRVVHQASKARLAIIAERAQYNVRHALQKVNRAGDSKSDLVAAVELAVQAADASACYERAIKTVDEALQGEYMDALVVFRGKSSIDAAAGAFKLTEEKYRDHVLNLLADEKSGLRKRVLERLPDLKS
ncbi:AAA family ATPase [Lysobacter capsici]|uniref:AAA family ATPase n=1 Tax=Lysobacter capsici TaxID=435897 RepID=UPI00177B4B63|nr:AAA family ATPase [Lysobacter capsici]UOF14179.1 AAA family ATPase [Lysobacter capsici]